jgi:hypothetical protein
VWLKKYWGVSLRMQAKTNYDNLISVLPIDDNDIENSSDKYNADLVSYANFDESLR